MKVSGTWSLHGIDGSPIPERDHAKFGRIRSRVASSLAAVVLDVAILVRNARAMDGRKFLSSERGA